MAYGGNGYSERSLNGLTALALLAFLLIYLKPYHGIRHDSILYLGQALLRWKPENFSTDLFFAYGGQTDFTVFPWVISYVLKFFSAAEVFQALTLLSLYGFALASFFLIRRLLPVNYRFYALLAVLIIHGGYGGHNVFSYAEPFFTGRSLAEPLVLASLAMWLSQKRVLAVMFWGVAAMMHPLQALVIPMLGYGVLIWNDRRWLHLLWLGVPFILVDTSGVAFLDRLLMRYDDQWYQWVVERSKQVFLFHWQHDAWGYWLTDIFLGWLIVQRASELLRQVARGLLLATILGMLATLLFADFQKIVFATGLQLWRAQWLLHWLAIACVPWLVIGQYRSDGGMSTRGTLLLAIVVYGVPTGWIAPSSLAVLFMIPLYLAWPNLEEKVSAMTWRTLGIFVYLTLVLGLVKYGFGILSIIEKTGGVREAARPEFILFNYPLVAGSMVAGSLWVWQHVKRGRIILLMLLAVLLVHAVEEWDRRSGWTRYIESAQYSPDLFGVSLEPAAQVYWEGELLAPWLILGRPSFIDRHQTAGVLFSRNTAAEAMRRSDLLKPYLFQREICAIFNQVGNPENPCIPHNEIIAEICAPGGPDYLVLTDRLKVVALGTWSVVGGPKGNRPITYYLYRCGDAVALGAAEQGKT